MITWSRIDTVLLDMDGTLLDLHFDNRFWLEVIPHRFAADRGISVEAARTTVIPLMQAVQGTLDWYCLDYWQARLDIDIVELKRQHAQLIRFRPGAETFLSSLRAAGKRTVLVTNAHRASLSLKLERVPLASYLDGMISSHDLGAPKEAQVFWEALQAREGFHASRTVLLDDSAAVLSAARNYGLAAVFGIARPDSTQPPLAPSEFPVVETFEAINPLPHA